MNFQIRQKAAMRSDNLWDWEAWLDGPIDEINRVEYVLWELHPSFPEPIQRVVNRSDNFRLKYFSFGEFRISANVYLLGGESSKLSHWLSFRDESSEPANRGQIRNKFHGRPVFLSYSRSNARLCKELTDNLKESGIEVWSDINIPSGIAWADWLESRLAGSAAMLAVVTGILPKWCERELWLAKQKSVPIIFVCVGEVEHLTSSDTAPAGIIYAKELIDGDDQRAASRYLADQIMAKLNELNI